MPQQNKHTCKNKLNPDHFIQFEINGRIEEDKFSECTSYNYISLGLKRVTGWWGQKKTMSMLSLHKKYVHLPFITK